MLTERKERKNTRRFDPWLPPDSNGHPPGLLHLDRLLVEGIALHGASIVTERENSSQTFVSVQVASSGTPREVEFSL